MPEEDFICGYAIEVVGPHPVDFAARLTTARGMWGADLRRTMLDYNYFAGLGIVGEVLPPHDVPNLFICDGSVFTTSTAVNPSLTIEAIAARTADHICEIKRSGGKSSKK